MRIGFDAAPAFSAFSGIGQYVRSLFPAMGNLGKDIDWIGYLPKGSQERTPTFWEGSSVSYRFNGRLSGLGGNWDDEKPMNIFHGTNFKAPNYGQQHSVLTIHDLWLPRHPQYSKKFFGQAFSSWKLGRRANHASKIITVSQFSAQEIHEVFSIPFENISVIYHGCSLDMYVDRNEKKYQQMCHRLKLPARPYILCIGGAEPRKNHQALFKAFSQSKRLTKNFCLVAVGDVDTRGANLFRTAQEYCISDVVHCPGFVTSEDLRVLYSFAKVFVFPSLYEGFGIPVVEAMACGTPVISTDRTALPEIAGEAAWYVDPTNSEQLRERLEALLADDDQQNRMKGLGLQRARQYTWDRAAHETLSLYREVAC